MDILGLSPEQFKSLILIFVRVGVVLFMFPFFGGIMVPRTVKAGLTLMITIVLFPVVRPDPALFPDSVLGLANLVLSELVLGMVVGLVARFFFAAVQLAGQLVGFQMGFAIANVFDPESGTQGTMLAQLGYWIAILFFLLLNGHHIVLRVISESFSVLQVGYLGVGSGMLKKMIQVSGDMFMMAVKIGAPAIAALLFTSAAFGIVAKVVPQMNVLIVAFPLKIMVGLFFFGLSLELLLYFMRQFLGGFPDMLGLMMRLSKV
ncbi:MAG: flagellar biosynthetic protein FliR [Deltaproteobacteria bacterium]|nr:flagellar biosynthetic protein FliR [Deltaproteobacteria bacterium]